MEYELILTSAKIIPPEQQYIGKLPPLIYPINGRSVFDYLYEKYSGIVSGISIACYEKKDKLISSLGRYQDSRIKFVELDQLRDLGYSIYKAIEDIDIPIIINFGDTIITDDVTLDSDCIYYSEEVPSSDWAFYVEKDGRIIEIFDKEEIDSIDEMHLIVGVFTIVDTSLFKKCLKDSILDPSDKMNTFFQALLVYSRYRKIKSIKVNGWLDIGHADRYISSGQSVKSREFNHIHIDIRKAILRKTSENKEKLIDEILWYLKLPADVEYIRPRLYSYSVSYTNPFVEMEYYAYTTLHELLIYGDLKAKQWKNIFEKLLWVCKDFSHYTVKNQQIDTCIKEMYLDKTEQRLLQLRDNINFAGYFDQPIYINGTRYLSLDMILNILRDQVPKRLFGIDEFQIIHGDMCFSNIMIDPQLVFIKLIDPRGRFGEFDIYGDVRYEYAKIMHSIDGKYDYIIKDLFELNIIDGAIEFKIVDVNKQYDIVKIFRKVFESEIKDDIDEVTFIEALLFLSMIPLHNENLMHQYAMLATGIQILDRIIDIREENNG